MNAEQLKSETERFLDKKLTTIKCCGADLTITGMGAAVTAVLVIAHVIIAKCVCSRIRDLKHKVRSYEAAGSDKQ